jgi:hypothetical protein
MAGPIDIHIERLLSRWPEAKVSSVDGAGTSISLPNYPLPAGWNKPSTSIHFLAPQGYPFAKPDCFWTDEDLRLASGELPKAANFSTAMPGLGRQALWFSWHTDHWNANRDDLLTWVATIQERLSRVV